MEEDKKIYLTKDGLKKIKEEYQKLLKLKKAKTKEEAPLFLCSEDVNIEFLYYEESLEYLEKRIKELEYALKNYELIKLPSKKDRDKIYLGARVKIDLDNELDEFTIVGTFEANPLQKKISNECPIGKALIGHKVGDKILITTTLINHTCRILKIEYK